MSSVYDILVERGFIEQCTHEKEARRLVQQGGVTVNDVKVPAFDSVFGSKDFNENGAFMVKKGKKGFYQIKAN